MFTNEQNQKLIKKLKDAGEYEGFLKFKEDIIAAEQEILDTHTRALVNTAEKYDPKISTVASFLAVGRLMKGAALTVSTPTTEESLEGKNVRGKLSFILETIISECIDILTEGAKNNEENSTKDNTEDTKR